MTPVGSFAFVARRTSSMPERPGMRTSTSATRGRRVSIFAKASSPLRARPATSISWSSSTAQIASTIAGWSSATRQESLAGALSELRGWGDIEHLPDRVGERARVERLLEERPGDDSVGNGPLRVARHVDDLDAGSRRGEALHQLEAAHLRHDHVGDDEVDGAVVVSCDRERLATGPGGQDGVAPAAQVPTDQVAHDLLVLDDQHGLGSPARGWQRRSGGGVDRLLDPGKVDLEGRPLARLAVDPDEAAALLDDPVHGGEPESGPLSDLLRGEERLERVRLRLRVHAAARVAHLEYDVGPGPHPAGPTGRERLVHVGVRRLDDEAPTVRHGVARVHHEVGDHLLELARVGLDAAEVRLDGGDQLDVLADQAPQHPLHVLHDLVQVEDPWLEHLPAAESEELAREVGRPLGRALHLPGVPAPWIVVGESTLEEVGVPQDPGQQVVEVVRDAPGETADGFQLLRPEQLLLEPLVLRDVFGDHEREPALVVAT